MQRALLLSLISAAAMLTAGCGTTYSQISGSRYYRTNIDTYPVSVVKIDGRGELRNPAYVEPGIRQVTVQAPPGGGHSYGEQQTITLDVKPCMRYWLVAVKEGPLSSKFTTKVDHEETISGCSPPA